MIEKCLHPEQTIGIDLGLKALITCSNGEFIPNNRTFLQYARHLRLLNKELSRRTKGSSRWRKTVRKLQKAYAKLTDVRADHIHKAAAFLATHYGTICMEDLNVKGMVRNRRLAKHVSDASFGEIRR